MTDEDKWEEWELEHAKELQKVKDLRNKGHTYNCAYRLVWGDGICTCRLGLKDQKKEDKDGMD